MPRVINKDLPIFEKFGRDVSPGMDPTKSAGLRKRWSRQMRVRWSKVQAWVRQSVVVGKGFEPGGQFSSDSPTQSIKLFLEEFQRVERETILNTSLGMVPWITPFVREAYAKGLLRGNRDLKALAREHRRGKRTPTGNSLNIVVNLTPPLFEVPTLDPDNILDAIQAGERARLFELEVFRTWEGITNVTAQVNAQVGAVIAQGLESRATPAQLAKDINDRVDKIGKTRSELIARTETVAANNRGAVAEFAEAERLTGFDVHVQWETALDSRVRDTHIVRHGDVYTKEVGRSLIGEPNCLLPDTMVFSPSRVAKMYQRRYEGSVVILTTGKGRKVSCTPNHPIMTDKGFVPAGQLVAGDNLIAVRDPDYVGVDVESKYRYFGEGGYERSAEEVATQKKHFHGDGIDDGNCFVKTDFSVAINNDALLMADQTDISEYDGIEKDFVMGVYPSEYSGFVYNLETETGNYCAQGLILKNCRCALLPYIPAVEGDVDLSSGKAALALTPEEAKNPARRERKKLGVPQEPPGEPVKKSKRTT